MHSEWAALWASPAHFWCDVIAVAERRDTSHDCHARSEGGANVCPWVVHLRHAIELAVVKSISRRA